MRVHEQNWHDQFMNQWGQIFAVNQLIEFIKSMKVSFFPKLGWVQHFHLHFLMRYQNACYRCENAENQTWSPFFKTDESVGGSVNVIDTTWGCIYFSTCKNFEKCGLLVQWPFIVIFIYLFVFFVLWQNTVVVHVNCSDCINNKSNSKHKLLLWSTLVFFTN